MRTAEVSDSSGQVVHQITNQELSDIGAAFRAPNRLRSGSVDPNATCPTPGEPIYASLNMADGTTKIELNLAEFDCGGVDFTDDQNNRQDFAGLLSGIADEIENP